ncbi:MAG: hypothetical protein DWQ05_21615 [Calditrichaeota bacterium]|nr:MAG: hypothetical protein DWQ05_21615 [Calditrichota bacterium]
MTRKIFKLIALICIPLGSFAQEKSTTMIFGKVSQEYRNNILRLRDSTKIDDYRTNLYFSLENKRKLFKKSRLDLFYELRHHRYDEFQKFSRHDHLGNLKFQQSMTEKIHFHVSNELRARFSSTEDFSYIRNIANIYLNIAINPQNRAYIGIQNWSKDYFDASDYQQYKSSRYYAKLNIQMTKSANLGLHTEYNKHEGNLYPGSRAADLNLELDGHRYIFISRLDKIFNRNLFATFAYRFENDFPAEIENEQTGQRINDESYDDLLAEDSDFGYIKNQFSLSSLVKLTPRFSLLLFYNIYNKEFKFWPIRPDGPKRDDQLLFLSHTFKVKLGSKFTFELQHIYEDNDTNLRLFTYQMNTIAAGISAQF